MTARARHDELGLGLDDVKGMYRKMLETRMVSERILQLNRMGRTPFGAGTDGHEAAQIGAAWNIRLAGKGGSLPTPRGLRQDDLSRHGVPVAPGLVEGDMPVAPEPENGEIESARLRDRRS